MKTFKKPVILLLLFTLITGICAAQRGRVDPLDAAIRETSNYLNNNLTKGNKIVILNIQSDSGALSEYIIDELISNAVNDKHFLVVDRQQLDAIRAEQNFQFSGEVDDKQAMEIGKFFGAQTIVSGAMGLIGKDYRLRVRALEVQTALVQGQFNQNIAKSTLITTLIASRASGSGGGSSGGGASSRTSSSSNTSSSSSATSITIANNTGFDHVRVFFFDSKNLGSSGKYDIHDLDIGGMLRNNETKTVTLPRLTANVKYTLGMLDENVNNSNMFRKDNIVITNGMTITFTSNDQKRARAQAFRIGETGPAGGIIFYDKGNNSGGWRYLEAAPVEAEFQAPWSIRGTGVENTQSTIGSGKRNTQLIVATFSRVSGEWDTAAQKCDDLEFGGFDDWFLPSKDELDQMYGQLKRRNLGDFKNEWYWASSGSSPYYLDMQHFRDGSLPGAGSRGSTSQYYVRPIRQVPGPAN